MRNIPRQYDHADIHCFRLNFFIRLLHWSIEYLLLPPLIPHLQTSQAASPHLTPITPHISRVRAPLLHLKDKKAMPYLRAAAPNLANDVDYRPETPCLPRTSTWILTSLSGQVFYRKGFSLTWNTCDEMGVDVGSSLKMISHGFPVLVGDAAGTSYEE